MTRTFSAAAFSFTSPSPGASRMGTGLRCSPLIQVADLRMIGDW